MKLLFIPLLLVTLLTTGCSRITSLGKQHYGPFEVNIVAEDGERVEDVIVTLMQLGIGFIRGSEVIYEQTKVVNTNEPIVFPRGYVKPNSSGIIAMYVSISHPFYAYGSKEKNVSFKPKPEGVITLKTQTLRSRSQVHHDSNQAFMEDQRNRGVDEVKIQEKLANQMNRAQSAVYSSINNYFRYAIEIGRDDLVDRYLPMMIQMAIDENKDLGWDKEKKEAEFRQKLYQNGGNSK